MILIVSCETSERSKGNAQIKQLHTGVKTQSV